MIWPRSYGSARSGRRGIRSSSAPTWVRPTPRRTRSACTSPTRFTSATGVQRPTSPSRSSSSTSRSEPTPGAVRSWWARVPRSRIACKARSRTWPGHSTGEEIFSSARSRTARAAWPTSWVSAPSAECEHAARATSSPSIRRPSVTRTMCSAGRPWNQPTTTRRHRCSRSRSLRAGPARPGGHGRTGGHGRQWRARQTVERADAVMRMFGDVSVSVGDDRVATAEIQRPPDNFFDAGLVASLADGYEWADQAGARAIVLCSEGKHFCAGADFTGRSSAGNVAGGGVRQLYDEAVRLFEAPLPVVAAVQGAAVGGGLGLACSADFRVASPQARFCANFARLGLHQGFGLSATLPAIVGQQAAWDLLYTGRRVSGAEAAEIGLADRLAASVRETARELAAQLAESAPL